MDGIISGKVDSGAKKFNVLKEITVHDSDSQYSSLANATFTPPISGTAYSGNGSEIYVELTGQGNKNTPLYIPLFSAYYTSASISPPSSDTITLCLYRANYPSNNKRYDIGCERFRYGYDYTKGYIFLSRLQYDKSLKEILSRIRIGTLS